MLFSRMIHERYCRFTTPTRRMLPAMGSRKDEISSARHQKAGQSIHMKMRFEELNIQTKNVVKRSMRRR